MCSLEELILQIALVAGAIFSRVGPVDVYFAQLTEQQG